MTTTKEIMPKDPSLLPYETSFYFHTLMKAKKFVEVLLHQQLWFFGNDIKIHNKNLLINYGFKQVRPLKGLSGSTNYIYRTDEATLVLWGFGVFLSERNNKGVYIGRYNFYPSLIKDELLNFPICAPSNLPEMKYPESVEDWDYCFRLISEFFEWIASYELWVNWIMGSSYRKTCLKDWDQSIVSSDEMSWAWNKVADFFSKNLEFHEKSKKYLFQNHWFDSQL
tara:strand:+ start:1073 stop:1744 length:672 start_codon:yes stop_codon:yes gene_type:complete